MDGDSRSSWLKPFAAAASDLDSVMASKLLAGFLANGRAAGLIRLSDDAQVNTGTVADDIVAAWCPSLRFRPEVIE